MDKRKGEILPVRLNYDEVRKKVAVKRKKVAVMSHLITKTI
jgi:hypothetical protein